jgi:hypothetical protein
MRVLEELLGGLRRVCASFPDGRQWRPDNIAIADAGLAAFSLFFMQIELTFKRLKVIAQIGHVPKHDEKSSRAWLYEKLLVALLSQNLARVGKAISPWGYYLSESAHAQPLA